LTFFDNSKKAENIPTITLSRALRDGVAQNVPWSLLITGDVLMLGFGDIAPGRLVNIPAPGEEPFPDLPDFILDKSMV
jgi:hypothetical protein